MEQAVFRHLEIVQIRHVKTQKYIKGTIHPYMKDGLFKKSTIDNSFYVGTTSDADDFYTYWQFEKSVLYNSAINQGDLVLLYNYATSLYLISNPKEQSEVSKQSLMAVGDIKQQFILQPVNDPFDGPQIKQECPVIPKLPIRIINAYDNMALHSHLSKYSNESVSKYNEVTGFKGRDDNDWWEIVKVPIDKLTKLNIEATADPDMLPLREINDKEVIIIRNFHSGYSLHSHGALYKSTAQQEVTNMRPGRDDNDHWCITKVHGKSSDGLVIQNQDGVQLNHVKSKKNLVQLGKVETYSGSGLQVTCIKEQTVGYWKLLVINGKSLTQDSCFFILHVPSGRYLSATNNPSETTTYQREVALTVNPNANSVWLIE